MATESRRRAARWQRAVVGGTVMALAVTLVAGGGMPARQAALVAVSHAAASPAINVSNPTGTVKSGHPGAAPEADGVAPSDRAPRRLAGPTMVPGSGETAVSTPTATLTTTLSVMPTATPTTTLPPPGIISTYAGGARNEVLPTDIGLEPDGVVMDGPGCLLISDSGGNVVWMVNLSQHPLTRFGKTAAAGHMLSITGTGSPGFSGDGGPADADQLARPGGLAVDQAGNLFIADYGNRRVRRVDVRTGTIATVAGGRLVASSGASDPGKAFLKAPTDVALDSMGNLYIADAGSRVLEVVARTGRLRTVVQVSYAGGTRSPITATLGSIGGLAVNQAGDLFVTDPDHARIWEIQARTGKLTSVAGTGVSGFSGDGGSARQARFGRPFGVVVNSAGALFIADALGDRIRAVDARTGMVSTIAGSGRHGFSGDAGPALHANLAGPLVLTVDEAGNLYVADGYNNRVRKIALQTGLISTVAGDGLPTGSRATGGPAQGAYLANPEGMAVDGAGNLFIADAGNNRLVEVVARTGAFSVIAGTGMSGFNGDRGPATRARLISPWTVAVGRAGTLFIGERDRVREVVTTTGLIRTVPVRATGPVGANSLAVDDNGNLFIASNHLVWELTSASVITRVAGTGTDIYNGDNRLATDANLTPGEVAVDHAGYLYIADWLNDRVRRVTLATGVITTVAGTGLSGFSGDGGPATAAHLWLPTSIAVDGAGNLFIADGDNRRIREVIHATGVITTVVGGGTGGDGSPAIGASLTGLSGIAMDGAGNLFIADTVYNRVRVVAGIGSSASATMPASEMAAPH